MVADRLRDHAWVDARGFLRVVLPEAEFDAAPVEDFSDINQMA